MSSIATTVTHRFTAVVIRGAWATIRAGERIQGLGARLEAWADRRRCVEDVLSSISAKTLSH